MPIIAETKEFEFLSEIVNKNYTKHTHPWHLYRSWLLHKDKILPIQTEMFQYYNQLHHPNGTMIFSTDIYFPILCVDSPLYLVEFAADHSIANIIRRNFLLSAATIAKWPEQTPHYFVNVGKELLITITTPDSLGSLLEIMHKWFLKLSVILQDNVDIVMRASLETSAYEYLLQLSRAKDIKIWAGIR